MSEPRQESLAALQELGFTELEAAVYAFLLGESPATGYRIALAIGKPNANTYKAIAALEARGALIVEDGAGRLCRAVPPAELLGGMERQFQARRKQAEQALARLGTSPEDDRVYHLRTRDGVFERARQMLGRAEAVVFAALAPEPAAGLREELAAAAARGVVVFLKLYRAEAVPGARIVISSRVQEMLELMPGEELNLVVDGREHLLAMLERDGKGLQQAMWSHGAFLCYAQHNGLYCEWALTALAGMAGRGVEPAALEAAIDPAYFPFQSRGFLEWTSRQAGPAGRGV